MTLNAAEFAMQVKMTKAFIDADKSTVTIYRRTKIRTNTGGFTEGPRSAIGIFDVRMVPKENVGAVEELSTTDGRRAESGFTLVAMPDADISRYDEFEWKGSVWQVWFVRYMPEYTLKGDVRLHGIQTGA